MNKEHQKLTTNVFLHAFELMFNAPYETLSAQIFSVLRQGDLKTDLGIHFDTNFAGFPSNRKQPAPWIIEFSECKSAWEDVISVAVKKWIFESRHSVNLQPWQKQEAIETLLIHILEDTELEKIYRFNHRPPDNVLYEVAWEDFIIEGQKGTFVLHFGISD